MNEAWYQVASMLFGYGSAVIMALVLLLGLGRHIADRALWHRVTRGLPRAGAAGTLKVLSGGSRRLPAGTLLRIPYEGTMGASRGCDVQIPYRRVHLRSAFFWMEKGEMHMVPLHKDGFSADGITMCPGDEAVLESGAVLEIGNLRMLLTLRGRTLLREPSVGPYVTTERRGRARQGRGEGIGAPAEKRTRGKSDSTGKKPRGRKQEEEEDLPPRRVKRKRDAGEPGQDGRTDGVRRVRREKT